QRLARHCVGKLPTLVAPRFIIRSQLKRDPIGGHRSLPRRGANHRAKFHVAHAASARVLFNWLMRFGCAVEKIASLLTHSLALFFSQQIPPRTASPASFIRKGISARAATLSSHHQPSNLVAASPIIKTIDK